jgi:hypothetical protein
MDRLFTAIAFLLLGLAASVVVAWAAVYFARYEHPRGIELALREWEPVRDWPDNQDSIAQERHIGLTVVRAVWQRTSPDDGSWVSWEYTCQYAGFPFRCLRSEFRPVVENPKDPLNPLPNSQAVVDVGIKLHYRRGDTAFATAINERFLPLRPIPLGLLANTLLYALAVFSVHRLFIKARGAARRRRGRCASCGFPQGTSDVCSECGSKLRAA